MAQRRMIELRPPEDADVGTWAAAFDAPGVTCDARFTPVPMAGGTVVVLAEFESEEAVVAVRHRPEVVGVWDDPPVAPLD